MKPNTHFPTIWQAIGLHIVILFFGLGLLALFQVFGKILDLHAKEVPGIHVVATFVSTSLVVFWAYRKTDASFYSVFPLTPIRPRLLLPMLVTLIGLGIVVSEIGNVVRHIFPISSETMSLYQDVLGLGSDAWIKIFGTAIILPIIEEVEFRGLILYGFLKNYTSTKAILTSAALFGLIHLNIWQFPVAFGLGILFSWWTVKTGSLIPGLLGHMLNNTLVVLCYQFNIPIFSDDLAGPVQFQPLWVNLVGLMLTILGILWLQSWFETEGETRLGIERVEKILVRS